MEKEIDEGAIVDLLKDLVLRVDRYILDQKGHVPDNVTTEFERRDGIVTTRAKVTVHFTRGPDRCS